MKAGSIIIPKARRSREGFAREGVAHNSRRSSLPRCLNPATYRPATDRAVRGDERYAGRPRDWGHYRDDAITKPVSRACGDASAGVDTGRGRECEGDRGVDAGRGELILTLLLSVPIIVIAGIVIAGVSSFGARKPVHRTYWRATLVILLSFSVVLVALFYVMAQSLFGF